MNEEQLLKDIEADPRKFGLVYEAFYNRIFGYVYRRTTDYEATSDITSETFLKAFLNIGRFKWRNVSMLYWLYRIATNELNKYHNSKKYRPGSLCRIREEYGIDFADHTAGSDSTALKEELEKHQEFLKLNEALRKLDAKYQDVISLRFFEEKSINEISLILGKNEGTIKSLLSRGIGKLKNALK